MFLSLHSLTAMATAAHSPAPHVSPPEPSAPAPETPRQGWTPAPHSLSCLAMGPPSLAHLWPTSMSPGRCPVPGTGADCAKQWMLKAAAAWQRCQWTSQKDMTLMSGSCPSKSSKLSGGYQYSSLSTLA